MKRAIVALVMLGALGSCRFIPGTQAHEIAEAQKAVRYQLDDPDAGHFRNDRIVGRLVCGEVNGKNQMGAYTGFRPYAYDPATRKVFVLPELDGTSATALAIIDFPKSCMGSSFAEAEPTGTANQQVSDDLNAAADDAIHDLDRQKRQGLDNAEARAAVANM